jgi:hypothetical protein
MRTLPKTALALFLLLGACVDDNVSVFTVGMALPAQSDGSCTYDTSTTLASGIYDPSQRDPYLLFPIVQNALISRANEIRPETNGVFIQRAVVSIVSTAAPDTPIVEPYSVPASGYVPPGGQVAIGIEAIPASIALAPGQYILDISLRGETQGEIEIDTGDFSWPVSVCNGCLFPPCVTGEDAPTESLGQCSPGSNFELLEACP